MLRSSIQPHISKTPTAPIAPITAPKSGFVRAIQAFWRFSKFYGEFMSTPIHKRKIR